VYVFHTRQVTNPVVAKDVMIDRPQLFQKEGTAFFPNSSLAGNGLLVSDGDVWRRQRRLSNPAFRAAAVASYAHAMTEATSRLLDDRWTDGVQRDVYADFNDLSLTIVTEALFGTGIEDESDQREIREAIAEAFDFFGRRASGGIAVPEWVPTPENLRFMAAVRRLDELVYALIARRRAHQAAQAAKGAVIEEGEHMAEGSETVAADIERYGLLDWLLAARDDDDGGDGGGMSDTALRDEMNTLIIAGAETTAISLSFTCALLAQHPALAERVGREAEEVMGSRRRPVASDYAALPLTQAVVLEVLRLLPPAYMVRPPYHGVAALPASGGISSLATARLVMQMRDATCRWGDAVWRT
jgi:cytochrome P450